ILRRDPQTQGPRLFKQKCAGCHTYTGGDVPESVRMENKDAKAGNLAGWGSKKRITGLLRDPGHPDFFGKTPHKRMDEFVRAKRSPARAVGKEPELDAHWDVIAGWLASHPHGNPPSKDDKSDFAVGYRAFTDPKYGCLECHTYKGEGGMTAPDMTGYGDA